MKLKLWMVFEAVAPTEEDLRDSLHEHVEEFANEEEVEIEEKDYDDMKELENPHPGLEKGYSQVCELKAYIENYPSAVSLCMSYGPTYVQVEEPDRLEMNLAETQDSLQKVVDMMHQYAQMGAGGIMVSKETD